MRYHASATVGNCNGRGIRMGGRGVEEEEEVKEDKEIEATAEEEIQKR